MKIALVLSLVAMFLQLTVFLQPLLPKELQISLVCITVSELKTEIEIQHKHPKQLSEHHHHIEKNVLDSQDQHNHHSDHQCLYCTVYGHLSTHIELSINTILDRIQIRLMAFKKNFKHIYVVLQRLFLSPQSRAPPLLV